MKKVYFFIGMLLFSIGVWGQVVWSGVAACAGGPSGTWLNAPNWCGGVLPGSGLIAQFGALGTAATIGVNMNGISVPNKTIGAIEVSSGNTVVRTINNSSTAVGAAIVLNGSTVNSVSNVILRNNSSTLLTIANGSSQPFGISLGNTTDNIINIDGTGGITIVPIIRDSTLGAKKLTKAGAGSGVLTLSGANTYSGGTTITTGVLNCGAINTIPSTGTVTLNGGTLRTGSAAGFNQSAGTLSLTEISNIILGTGVHTLNFANSSAVSWTAGKTLTITGWTGGYNGTSGTGTKIFAGTDATGLTTGQLAQIQFFDGVTNFAASILSTGEVVAGVGGGTPTKLAITTINPASPTVNAPFSVTVQSQDAGNVASNVVANTNVTLSLNTGSGILGGTLTGTILAGTNSIVISGVTYNTVENGIIITATRIAGDALTPGNSAPFNVLAAASQLVLVGVPTTGFTNTNLTTFTVEARRPNNTVDSAYTSNITIAKVSGPGNVVGTVSAIAVAGVATFNAVQINAAGTYTINASDGILTSATSGNIVIVPPPTLNEFLLPQYIQGVNGTNNNRLPYVYRASLTFLVPNTTYRYYNITCTASELLTPFIGAGNAIYYNSAGNFTRTASVGLSTAGSYGTFTTDASGSYTGWFITEPTANVRFTPGSQLHMRIILNDGLGGTSPVLTLTTLNTAIVTNLGATPTDGTGIYGMTHTANRELVFLYDNTSATGRPLTSTYIEDDGTTGGAAYPTFYQTNVDAVTKTWGTFIPNTLANGVRRIQYMNATGSNVYAFTSTDGAWPGAVSTVNPTGGTTALVISRTATGTSGDFIVDSAVVLATPVVVNNSLTLNNGIVTSTAANLLSVTAAGSTTGASNASFVFGPVKKTGNTPFIFPVGKTNGYLPIRVSNFTVASAPTDQFTAEYMRASGVALGPITAFGIAKVSSCEYWNLAVNAGTPTVDLTLYWNANNPCNGAYITSVPDVEIAHFDGANWNSSSVGFSSIGGGSNNAAGNVTWSSVSTFSPFTIASRSAANPLPIIINYITGTKSGSNHLLNWRVTCVSVPSATIELERSTDGRNYSSIYSIFATALRCEQPFNYIDMQPVKGINYYRLKMTDADGKITYSTVVPLINAVKGTDVMSIAPNPVVNSSFNLKVSAAVKTQMQIVITDMQGRTLQKQSVSLIAGFNIIPMNVKNLAAGTYQLVAYTEDEKKVLRFVIQ